MSRKHAELERELIEDLAPRTGRSLAEWMAAIDAAALVDKNAIIDWLRPQGLTFQHASWLERIHNNGGRPLYLEGGGRPAPAVPPPPPLRVAPPPSPLTAPPPPAMTAHAAKPLLAQPRPPAPADAPREDTPTLPELLARAKGLRPLADMLLREMIPLLPDLAVVPCGELISLRRPAELGVLLPGPRELRLGLDLGAVPFGDAVVRARIPSAGPRITHMIVLNDARQIAAPLLDLVLAADVRANPPA